MIIARQKAIIAIGKTNMTPSHAIHQFGKIEESKMLLPSTDVEHY